jgi:hypothetical protein
VQPLRLRDCRPGVEGEVRVDLDRDVSVLALAVVPDRAEEVARLGDIAFWKIVGLVVTPTTASSLIIRSSPPLFSSRRERKSIQTLCPSSES